MFMIRANTNQKWLPLYEALASEVRLKMIEWLAERPMNVKELAEAAGISSAITTMHVRKLEKAGIIQTTIVRKQRGTHKICVLAEHTIEIVLPSMKAEERKVREVSIPVGHYSEFEVHPTCGLATVNRLIGQFDDPRYFVEPERMNAGIVWLGKGFLEYKIPNYLLPNQHPVELEIALEISSEAPGVNENWPSDISFSLNGTDIGVWTSPGDFGDKHGRYTPAWWGESINQYGLLKVIRILADGSYIDGQRMSDVGLDIIGLDRNQWTFRIAVKDDAENIGGLTLFGKGFGNYDQDILFRVHYEGPPRVT